MPTYRVLWEIDVDANTLEEAVARTKEIQLDPNSEANFFTVTDEEGKSIQIELIDMDNQIVH